MPKKAVLPFVLLFIGLTAVGQITDSVFETHYFNFLIKTQKEKVAGSEFFTVSVFKSNKLVLADTVFTDKKNCTGFAFPDAQPFKEYFIFSKHQKGNGKTYILSGNGDYSVINGGTFWAAPKHYLLFLLAERDLTNLVIYSLKDKAVLLEKFNCDEFDGWYYLHGNYMGSVVMECGLEPEQEREISEWMHPVEAEQYEPGTRKLYEVHTTQQDLEKAKRLVRYAGCK